MKSSEREEEAISSAITLSPETAIAAAASPKTISSPDSGAPTRASEATTNAVLPLPAATASKADRRAAAPHRSDAPKSAAATFAGKSQHAAIRLAAERCQYGAVVEAK